MRGLTHRYCLGVRGIKFFICLRCGQKTNNYMNGIEMCNKCCEETNTCTVCGQEIDKEH